MQRKPPPPRRHAWDPVLLTEGELADIKAMASNHPLGWDAIVNKLCRYGEVSFAVGGEDGRRETDYAEGKRAIGLTLKNIAATSLRPHTRGPEPGHVEPDLAEK